MRLSQAHVGRLIGVSHNDVIKIEQGNREISNRELTNLSLLYGVPVEIIIKGEEISTELYNDLTETDIEEIKNLIQYKINIDRQRKATK